MAESSYMRKKRQYHEVSAVNADLIRRNKALQMENEEWQACYEQQVELGAAQYNGMRDIALRKANDAIQAYGLLNEASQHGVDFNFIRPFARILGYAREGGS